MPISINGGYSRLKGCDINKVFKMIKGRECMSIGPYNINNVLRTYSHNFKIGKVVSAAGELDSSKKSELDKVDISPEARKKFEILTHNDEEFDLDSQTDEQELKAS